MYYIKKWILPLVLSLITFNQSFSQQKSWSTGVQSPDKRLELTFSINEQDELSYSFTADGKLLLNPSLLGPEKKGKLVLNDTRTRTISTVWKPVWGKCSLVLDSISKIHNIAIRSSVCSPNLC